MNTKTNRDRTAEVGSPLIDSSAECPHAAQEKCQPSYLSRFASAFDTSKTLTKCPKCGEIALQTQGARGEDDHGQLEGEYEWCEKCDYADNWISRC